MYDIIHWVIWQKQELMVDQTMDDGDYLPYHQSDEL